MPPIDLATQLAKHQRRELQFGGDVPYPQHYFTLFLQSLLLPAVTAHQPLVVHDEKFEPHLVYEPPALSSQGSRRN